MSYQRPSHSDDVPNPSSSENVVDTSTWCSDDLTSSVNKGKSFESVDIKFVQCEDDTAGEDYSENSDFKSTECTTNFTILCTETSATACTETSLKTKIPFEIVDMESAECLNNTNSINFPTNLDVSCTECVTNNSSSCTKTSSSSLNSTSRQHSAPAKKVKQGISHDIVPYVKCRKIWSNTYYPSPNISKIRKGPKSGHSSDYVKRIIEAFPIYCCAKGCPSKSIVYDKRVCFYNLPKDPSLLEQWLNAVEAGNQIDDNQKFVCSLHFTSDDFYFRSKLFHNSYMLLLDLI